MSRKATTNTDGGTVESATILRRYAAKLEVIATLDRAYYAAPEPSLIERSRYYQRQAVVERMRLWLYAELHRLRQRAGHSVPDLPN
jgi:hypothetical protein